VSIGGAIRAAREAKGWKQTELASGLGVAPETVSRWETGRKPVPKHTRIALETVLGRRLEGTVQSKRSRKATAKS